MPSLTQLEYILSLSRTKHFGRAAQECHVSQPSLSAQIQKAEDELGIVIFDRSKQPIMITEKGQRVIEQSRHLLREYAKLLEIRNDKNIVAGDFRLGIIPTLSSYVLPLFVESFSKKYPEVNLSISEYKTEELVRALHDDSLDAALIVTPLYDERLHEHSLFYEPFYLFVSNEHELAKKKYVNEADLDASTVWLLDEGHCFRDQVLKICLSKKKPSLLHNVHFASGNLETLINLVRRGRGYTLLPHLATFNLSKTEKEKNLKQFHKPVPTREVSLVTSRSLIKKEIVDALSQEIINNLPVELKSIKKNQIDVIDI